MDGCFFMYLNTGFLCPVILTFEENRKKVTDSDRGNLSYGIFFDKSSVLPVFLVPRGIAFGIAAGKRDDLL